LEIYACDGHGEQVLSPAKKSSSMDESSNKVSMNSLPKTFIAICQNVHTQNSVTIRKIAIPRNGVT
jgi:hypothetical protein